MKPIVEYTDYRKVVQDYYEDCKRRSSFTWREFAEKAGFSSAVYLKYVGEGKKNLSASGATQTAQAMGLEGFERAKPLEMAKACKPAITAAEVTEILKVLTKSGLLEKDSEGTYRQTDRTLFMDSFGVKDLVAKDLQVQMGELAVDAAKNMRKEERCMTGVTFGLTARSRERIEHEIAEFTRRMAAIAAEEEETEQVFRLNLQFFPLSENLKRRNENEKDAQ